MAVVKNQPHIREAQKKEGSGKGGRTVGCKLPSQPQMAAVSSFIDSGCEQFLWALLAISPEVRCVSSSSMMFTCQLVSFWSCLSLNAAASQHLLCQAQRHWGREGPSHILTCGKSMGGSTITQTCCPFPIMTTRLGAFPPSFQAKLLPIWPQSPGGHFCCLTGFVS